MRFDLTKSMPRQPKSTLAEPGYRPDISITFRKINLFNREQKKTVRLDQDGIC
jgi:hypothetical protein